VFFPDADDLPGETNDLKRLWDDGAWIVVWRSDGRWHFTRNRRYAKPGLQMLRRIMRREGINDANLVWTASDDAHGHLNDGADPVDWGQALYAAWEIMAADALPAKVAFLQLDVDEPAVDRVPAWMRPGLLHYASTRRAMRELLEEVYADD
jgi:hypothetical protein